LSTSRLTLLCGYDTILTEENVGILPQNAHQN